MHVRWKKRRHATNRQTLEPVCPHQRLLKPRTLTPVMMVYEGGKYKYAWRIGPGIRECCLKDSIGVALAAWWWEVDQRFKDLLHEDIEDRPGLAEAILAERDIIEKVLEVTVPRPTYTQRREYEEFRRRHPRPRRIRPKLPKFVKILEIPTWPCTGEELKRAWKKMALKHHPDRGGDSNEFVRVKEAFEAAKQWLER